MDSKIIDLIGAGIGWGAQHHEAEWGPQALKDYGLLPMLQQKIPDSDWRCFLKPSVPYTPNSKLIYSERLEQVAAFTQQLANEVIASFQQAHFPIVLGGDHSMAIGTWSGIITAMQARGQFGLIWMDAHMDAHTILTTPSQAIHGMPLAVLLGQGESVLVDLCAKGPKINPAHLVLIGSRSFEEGEAKLLKDLKVKIYFIEEVKKRGFKTIFTEALDRVTQNTKGFGLSICLDAFDPSLVPGTGSPVANGLDLTEVLSTFKESFHHHQLSALEIAEFDPTRDRQHQTAGVIRDLLLNLCQSRKDYDGDGRKNRF